MFHVFVCFETGSLQFNVIVLFIHLYYCIAEQKKRLKPTSSVSGPKAV